MKKSFSILLFFTLWALPLVTWALEVGEDVRKNFTKITQEICHASVEYTLELPFIEAKKNYHETVGCLFDSAQVKAQTEINKSFNERFFNKIFTDNSFQTSPPKPLEGNCDGRKIDAIFQKQEAKKYKSLCVVKGRASTEELQYSPCRVSELAWNEFCAYQEYLIWKVSDRSVFTEYKKEDGTGQKSEWFNTTSEASARYKNERDLAHRTLWASLEQFHTFEQNYRIHLWKKVIEQALLVTQSKIALLEKAFKSWPAKKFQK